MPIVSKDIFFSVQFNYLVVGGGTAGLVVATRLTENPDIKVGVIEAGKDHAGDTAVTIPGMMGRNMGNPNYDWEFYTEPQPDVLNRKIQTSRGKGLGGSSMLNNLAFVRPTREELDAVESLGNPGWSWDSFLHYMKKSEHLFIPPFSKEEARELAVIPDPQFHGTDGPIAVSFPPYISPIHKDLLDSLESLGIHRNPESGARKTVGSLLIPSSVDPKTATRSYAASAYLEPNLERSNLFVVVNAFATKIYLEEQSDGLQRAMAVNVVIDGQEQSVMANKEIILSAGTFQTPQLLEVSGIGDHRILKALDIKCIIDLPGVGENLQDHLKVPTIAEIDKKFKTFEILQDPEQLRLHQELYKEQKGLLAGLAASCFAFIPGNILGGIPDVQRWKDLLNVDSSSSYAFKNTNPDVLRGLRKQYEIMAKWVDSPEHPLVQLLTVNGHFPVKGLTPDPTKRYMTLLCAYTHPFSRGNVHITSKDAQVPPAIQPNFLSNPADVEILAKSVEFALRIYNTTPLANSIVAKAHPSFSEDRGDEQVKQYVRETLSTVHHPLGTAAMMPREDGGVVNPKLLVYGTSNLRIVDSSILPLQASCNICSLAYAIGEKAAEIIRHN